MRTASLRCSVVVLLAFVVMASSPTVAGAERTIALSTGKIELSLPPGGRATDSFMVANNGDEPLKVLVYTADATVTRDGTPKYERPSGDPAQLPKSPASWLTLRLPAKTQVIANTPYVELEPGEEIEVKFELRVPAGAAPGDHNAVIFFEMFDDAATEAGATSLVSGRIGARVVVRVAGDIVDRLELAPYAVRTFVVGTKVPYSFTVSNTGNVDKRIVPSLVVLDMSEAERMRSVIESNAVVYAGNAREYSGTLELQDVTFGRYILRAEIAYDKETGTKPGATVPERLTKDRVIFVVPTWLVVALVLILVLPVMWWVYRADMRRRSARRPAAERAGAGAPDSGDRPAGDAESGS